MERTNNEESSSTAYDDEAVPPRPKRAKTTTNDNFQQDEVEESKKPPPPPIIRNDANSLPNNDTNPPTRQVDRDEEEARKSSDDEEESDAMSYGSEDSDVEFFFRTQRQLRAFLQYEAERAERAERKEEEDEEEEDDPDDDSWEEFCMRVRLISHACGTEYLSKEVRGRHRTCCGYCHFTTGGSYYAVDQSGYAPKLCQDCVQKRSDLFVDLDPFNFHRLRNWKAALQKRYFGFQPFVPGGLFDQGAIGQPFCLTRNGEKRTYKDHKVFLDRLLT